MSSDQHRAGKGSLQSAIRLFYVGEEGFGTTYHRFMLTRLIWRLVDEHGLRSVAEVPCSFYEIVKGEGLVPGANSLAFAMKSCNVTFIDESQENLDRVRELWERNAVSQRARFLHASPTSIPVADDTYDLVWNDLATPRLPDPQQYLQEMRRISRLVLVVCENRENYGYPIYALKNYLAKTQGAYGAATWLHRGNVRRGLTKGGLRVVEEGLIDAPPWPGFGSLAEFLVRLHRPSVTAGGEEGSDFSSIANAVRKYSFIEESRLPGVIKTRFSHSFYVLAEKR